MTAFAAAAPRGFTMTVLADEPRPHRPARRFSKDGLRAMGRGTPRFVSALLILLSLAFLAFNGSNGTQKSYALFGISNPLCGLMDDDTQGYSQGSYKDGIDSILPFLNPLSGALVSTGSDVNKLYGTNATLYEQFGSSNLDFAQYLHHNGKENDGCFPITPKVENMIANFIFTIPKAVTSISIGMYQWASSPDLLKDFLKPTNCIVNGCSSNGGKGLKTTLYLNFLPAMIVLGALYMGWVGLVKKRSTEATQAAIWMFASAIFALIFMSNPSQVAQFGNKIVSEVNSSAMTGVTQSTSAVVGGHDPCYLKGNASTYTGTRMAGCAIWKAFLFTPWSSGQFGTGDFSKIPPINNPLYGGQAFKLTIFNGEGPTFAPIHVIPVDKNVDDIRVAMLYAISYSHDEQYMMQHGSGSGTHSDEAYYGTVNSEIWRRVKADLEYSNHKDHGNETPYYNPWRGSSPAGRINIAFAALIASLVGGILIVLISFSIIVLAVGMMMLILMSPLFLLVGAHPGFGRGIALKWLELLIGTVMKRIVLGFLLAVLIGTYQIILSTNTGFFSQVTMIIAIGVAAIIYRKPMLEAFNVISLGGSRSGIENGGALGQQAKKGLGFGVGAIAGGIVGGRAGGFGAGLRGAARGGVMGQRTGSPTRAGMMGGSAGRRAASRAKAKEREQERENDPIAYVNEQKRQASRDAQVEGYAQDDEWANDPEFQRRYRATQRERADRRTSTRGGSGSSTRPASGPGAGGGTGGTGTGAPASAPAGGGAPAAGGVPTSPPRPQNGGGSGGPSASDQAAAAQDRADAQHERDEAARFREEQREHNLDQTVHNRETDDHRRQQDKMVNDALRSAQDIVRRRDGGGPRGGGSSGGAGSARRPQGYQPPNNGNGGTTRPGGR